MKPWWPELLEEPYDDESDAKLKAVEEAGYKAVGVEDLGFANLLDLKTIATGGGATGDEQYHGTSSWHLARAFPGVEFPTSSFPVRASNPSDIQALKEKLLL